MTYDSGSFLSWSDVLIFRSMFFQISIINLLHGVTDKVEEKMRQGKLVDASTVLVS